MNTGNYYKLGINAVPNCNKVRATNGKFTNKVAEVIAFDSPDQVDAIVFEDNFDQDTGYFDNDPISIPSSPSLTFDDITLDTLQSVLINNSQLTDDYLSGSIVVQSNVCGDVDPIYSEPLYLGSDCTLLDLLLILELIKTTNNLGDTNESILLGFLGSFLPKDNIISSLLAQTTGSIYYFQSLIKQGQLHFQKCSIHKILFAKKDVVDLWESSKCKIDVLNAVWLTIKEI